MDIGQKQYANSDITISDLPPTFFGADWISTGLSDKNTSASFTVNADADVFVAMGVIPAQRPEWLNSYEATGLFVANDANGGHKLPVYRKRFKKDSLVNLGANKGEYMYTITVLPVTTLEPATDLRKTISYKADIAEINGEGIMKDTVAGKKVACFSAEAGGSVSFAISPGVADLYALRVKYYNQTDRTFFAKMKLLAADGTVMKEETLSFKPVAKNKSGTVSTTTGTSINAGNYKLVITAEGSAGLCISGIEMQ